MTAGVNSSSRPERGGWPRFVNGRRYPYPCWGVPFRGASQKLIDAHGPEGVEVIATGRKDKGEIALLSFGIERPVDKLAKVLEELGQNGNGNNPPAWSGDFEEPFEGLREGSRREDAGLVVISHGANGSGSEAALFGVVDAGDLSVVSRGLLVQAGLEVPAINPSAESPAG